MSNGTHSTGRFVLKGRLDADTVAAVEIRLLEAVAATEHLLVVDAAALDYISSAGIRAVLTAVKRMRAKGGGLCITDMRKGVREVLDLTGMTALLAPPPA